MGRKSTQIAFRTADLEPLFWPEARCHSETPGVSLGPLWDYDIEGEDEQTRDARFQIATAICDTCPIKQRCLEWATKRHESGIWGGAIFPSYPSSGLVKCSHCKTPIHGLRKERVADEPAGTKHFCSACKKV